MHLDRHPELSTQIAAQLPPDLLECGRVPRWGQRYRHLPQVLRPRRSSATDQKTCDQQKKDSGKMGREKHSPLLSTSKPHQIHGIAHGVVFGVFCWGKAIDVVQPSQEGAIFWGIQ